MAERAVARAKSGSRLYCAQHKIATKAHGVLKRLAMAEKRCDRGRERAASAMSIATVDTR